jgi:hypothetical protein
MSTPLPTPPLPALARPSRDHSPSPSRFNSGFRFDPSSSSSPVDSRSGTPDPHRHLSSLSRSPSQQRVEPLSFAESGELDEETHDGQALPPVDRGKGAWAFCLSALALETMIWGFAYSFGTILVWLEVRFSPFFALSLALSQFILIPHHSLHMNCVTFPPLTVISAFPSTPFVSSHRSLTTPGNNTAFPRSLPSERRNSLSSSSSRASILLSILSPDRLDSFGAFSRSLFLIPFYRRYPEYVKLTQWISIGLSCGSMFIASFATKPWELIVLCGVSLFTTSPAPLLS